MAEADVESPRTLTRARIVRLAALLGFFAIGLVAVHSGPKDLLPAGRPGPPPIERWTPRPGAPRRAAPGTSHWAFRPPGETPVPGPGHPVDAFLAEQRRREGLVTVPPMDPGRLLRRLTLDLTGVPPTLEELRDFLKDPSPEAYERAVDRLLASPRYGERWARHWMDVWRYTDEDGRVDKDGRLATIEWGSPHLWQWRDWIVRSLNADRGYDRMLRDMLAADEAEPDNPEALAGQGFIVRSYYRYDREIFLTDLVDHLPRAVLGLTLNCARCHDHRYDPITQEDYYRFRAFFECVDVKASTWTLPTPFTITRAWEEFGDLPTFLLERGDPKEPRRGLAIEPDVPEVLRSVALRRADLPPDVRTSGRRLALANWLTEPRHPLTARVAVNHVWARHFGRGLVPTPSDFGLRGKPPTHPALLDWLAIEFPRHGWSQKWLHRLIVTSQTYRLHSAAGPDAASTQSADPENRRLWRFPSRRMEAEVIRDSLLCLSGLLDERRGGPPGRPGDAEISTRRSLYFRSTRDGAPDFVCQFNPPDLEDCYERTASVLPQQALAMMNSEFAWRQAEAIAACLGKERGDFVETAFLLLLCRAPNAAERARAASFLADPANSRGSFVHALLNHNDFIQVR